MDESRQMIVVRRGNVVLDVPEMDKQLYLDKGYDIIDGTGRVVERCMPTDVHTLQTTCEKLRAENAKLRTALEETKAKLDELSQPVKKTSEPVTETAPVKTTRSRKKS